jgi:hypothetical protein
MAAARAALIVFFALVACLSSLSSFRLYGALVGAAFTNEPVSARFRLPPLFGFPPSTFFLFEVTFRYFVTAVGAMASCSMVYL